MAAQIIASLDSGKYSKSTSSRRYRTNQANVRSTTQRRGWMRKPSAAFWVIVTAQPHTRRTKSTKRLLKPLSAITSRKRGNRSATVANRYRPPSRSWTLAGITSKAQIKPSESTITKRLRPLIFFSSVVTRRAAPVRDLNGLTIHASACGRRRSADLQADLLTQSGVELFPDTVVAPLAKVMIGGLPRRQVVGQHAPGGTAAQVIEDGVENFPQVGRRSAALGATGAGAWQERLDTFPLVVREIRWVGFPCHARPQ